MSGIASAPQVILSKGMTENHPLTTLGDSRVTFDVIREACWPHFSAGQKIEMRLVHVFEMLRIAGF
jgi:hypothetical protein